MPGRLRSRRCGGCPAATNPPAGANSTPAPVPVPSEPQPNHSVETPPPPPTQPVSAVAAEPDPDELYYNSGDQFVKGLTNQTGYVKGNANGALNFGTLTTTART